MTLMNPHRALAVKVMVFIYLVCLSVYLLHVFCHYMQQQNKIQVPTNHGMDEGGTCSTLLP